MRLAHVLLAYSLGVSNLLQLGFRHDHAELLLTLAGTGWARPLPSELWVIRSSSHVTIASLNVAIVLLGPVRSPLAVPV